MFRLLLEIKRVHLRQRPNGPSECVRVHVCLEELSIVFRPPRAGLCKAAITNKSELTDSVDEPRFRNKKAKSCALEILCYASIVRRRPFCVSFCLECKRDAAVSRVILEPDIRPRTGRKRKFCTRRKEWGARITASRLSLRRLCAAGRGWTVRGCRATQTGRTLTFIVQSIAAVARSLSFSHFCNLTNR
ncbi:hypothetical protein F2P81_002569 [Scophthalmus maximus]|uniref:Uncharacterized protein n=1 Tax=Scophthalmus maximus TaxID=52904 RepID=A0A6A4TR22_SCOMX|nr:hypothetical protein F2P81_002569 [Scophthalmus maximus]